MEYLYLETSKCLFRANEIAQKFPEMWSEVGPFSYWKWTKSDIAEPSSCQCEGDFQGGGANRAKDRQEMEKPVPDAIVWAPFPAVPDFTLALDLFD